METYQLKKIIIIVLALMNLALLGLLGRNELQERSAAQQTLSQLQTLYASSGIELSLDEFPAQKQRASALVTLSAAKELSFAESFLGSTEVQESGSAMLYTSDAGTMRFRRNSFFELTMTRPTLSRENCLALLSSYGYVLSNGSTGDALQLVQTLSDTVVTGSTVSLVFADGFLQSAYGYYVYSSQEDLPQQVCSAADALSAFLQYVQENGLICGSIQAIEPAWQLSAETLFQSALLPVWLIETDAAFYYVNSSGNRISPLFTE